MNHVHPPLREPVEPAASRRVGELAAIASAAAERLGDPADTEALHDFRVALRRLRASLRAYGPALPKAARRKQLKRLKKLAAATDAHRDDEVHLQLLRDASEGRLSRPSRRAAAMVIGRIEQKPGLSDEELRRRSEKLLAKIRDAVAPDLESSQSGKGPKAITFREWTGRVVGKRAGTLAGHLNRIGSFDDSRRLHKARLAAKGLRYVLEPLRQQVVGVRTTLRDLERLQDGLGSLRDLQTLEQEIRGMIAADTESWSNGLALHHGGPAAAASKAVLRQCTDLASLIRTLQSRQRSMAGSLQRRCLGEKAHSLLQRLETLRMRLLGEKHPKISMNSADGAASDSPTPGLPIDEQPLPATRRAMPQDEPQEQGD